MGNPWITILYRIIIRPISNIVVKTLHNKTLKLVAKMLATNIGFVPDWLPEPMLTQLSVFIWHHQATMSLVVMHDQLQNVLENNDNLFNSLAPGKFEWNFRYLILQIISVSDGWGFSCELALRWMSLDLTDDKSTLVQVMAWCHQATSHYLSQCWHRSMSSYGVTRPHWVKATYTCLGGQWVKFWQFIVLNLFVSGISYFKIFLPYQKTNFTWKRYICSDKQAW